MLRRSLLLVWLVAIIGMLAPSIASAATSTRPETRVWGFELVAQTLVGRSSARTHEKHPENSNAYDELASGSPLAAEGALAVDGAPGALGITGRTGQTFEILDGVRRAKAAAELGQTTIEAQVEIGGKVVQTGRVPIDALRSPFKSALDVSTPPLMQRWLRVFQGTRSGDPLPPIVIQPGASGTPIQQLPFIF